MLELESEYQNSELTSNLEETKGELVKKESDVSWFSKSLSVVLLILIVVIALILFIYVMYAKRNKQAEHLSKRTEDSQKEIGELSKSINEKEKGNRIAKSTRVYNLLTFPENLTPLTDREKEVLLGVQDGLKDKEIGERLFISLSTVKHI